MTEIRLKLDLAELKDIYFGDRNHVYFFGPTTKIQSIVLVLALIGFPFLSWYSLKLKDNWLFIGATASFALICYDFWRKAQPIIKWKKSVLNFLDKTSKVKEAKVVYTNDYISYFQDGEETKVNWAIVTEAVVTERTIWLYGSSNLLFPRSAMTQPEFNALSKMIMDKVMKVKKTQ